MPEFRGAHTTPEAVTAEVERIKAEGFMAEVWECPHDWRGASSRTWHIYRLDIEDPDVVTRDPFEIINDPLPNRQGQRPWERA